MYAIAFMGKFVWPLLVIWTLSIIWLLWIVTSLISQFRYLIGNTSKSVFKKMDGMLHERVQWHYFLFYVNKDFPVYINIYFYVTKNNFYVTIHICFEKYFLRNTLREIHFHFRLTLAEIEKYMDFCRRSYHLTLGVIRNTMFSLHIHV